MATNPTNDTIASPRIFYGWILVVVLLLLVSIGMGTTVYLYSLVAGAVSEEFSAGRLAIMAGSTGMFLVIGLCSPTIGRMLDRYPSQRILVPGSIVMGGGFLWVAISTHVWMVVASYILFISIGAATLSLLATATILSRWFVQYRGLAIGIAALGTQFGGFFYPPLFAATMEAHDWRIAIGAMGVLIMIAGPLLSWLFVVDRPELKRLRALGAEPSEPPATQDAAPVHGDVGFMQLFRQRNFWLIVLIAGAGMATNATLLSNLSLFAVDMGEPVVRGAFLVSLVALIGVFASPFLGWLSDTVNIKLVVAIMTLSLAVACTLFKFAQSYEMLLLAAVFMGIGGGGVFPIYASLVGHLYATRVYGQVLGASTLLISVLSAFAPLFAGWVYDTTGSYRLLFLALLTSLTLLTFAISLLRVPGHPSEKFGAVAAA